MIKVFEFGNKTEWDNTVASFHNGDVYYSHGYVEAFMLHGDGDPILVYYESESMRGMYVAMKRDLSVLPWAGRIIQAGKWFDLTTPYGYGGWIFEGDQNETNLQHFYS